MFNLYEVFPEMQKIIDASHKRSVQYGIDPNTVLPSEEYRLKGKALTKQIDKQNDFYNIAKGQLLTLYALLKNSGFFVLLADKDGYILYTHGDADIMEHCKRRRCMPGYRWTEKDMGTCCVGLTLEVKCPIFIPGTSMFANSAQVLSNAGAPVFSVEDELLGMICLCGHSSLTHVHTLGLACQAAEAVTASLRERQALREVAIQNTYMTALLEAGSKGMVTVDKSACIVQTNQKARSILELADDCVGRNFEDLSGASFNLKSLLKKGQGFLVREVACSAGPRFIALDPIYMENGETTGAIISITRKSEVIQLAMKMAGSKAHFTFNSIIGKSKKVLDVLKLAKIATKNAAPVLIQGETGTGKELFAQAIHNGSDRAKRPFVAINCGAIPKELLESELFGYEEGSFTGASKQGRPGKLELADTGTIFLDEIGEMPFDMQIKLLRALQSGEVMRIGGVRSILVDFRIISATNIDLEKAIETQKFRADLFYRINTLSMVVPPLRERSEDVLLLLQYFIGRYAAEGTSPVVSEKILQQISTYPWPGNVRQLESAVERAIYLAQGGDLLLKHFGILEENKQLVPSNAQTPLRKMEEIERDAVKETLTQTAWNLTKAAQILGISRPTLYRILRKNNLTSPHTDLVFNKD